MGSILGLDFGTTNSALAANINGEVEVIDIDPLNVSGKTLKSVIYFNPERKLLYVGQEAVNQYIENDAIGRYIQSIKTFLPDQGFELTEIGKQVYTIDQLIAIILRSIKERGERSLGREVESVVLGRPVVFSDDSKGESLAVERLLSSAKLAGFKETYLQYEPIAAAMAFESSLLPGEERVVLVGDFGGGTSDFTVIRLTGRKYEKKIDRRGDILGLGGIYIGGDDFDSLLMWNKIAYYFGKDVKVKALMGDFNLSVPSVILAKLKKWHLIPQLRLPAIRKTLREIKMQSDKPDLISNLENLIECNYGYMLFRAIEKSKCDLSSMDVSRISLEELFLSIQEDISRIEFQEFIVDEIAKLKACIEDVVCQAGVGLDGIDSVFLAGGSSHIPIIKNIFLEKFGSKKVSQINAFTSVAYGLGLSGNLYLN